MAERDTICALASGNLPSAIAMIRVSGPAVSELSYRLLGKHLVPRYATLAPLYGTDKEQIDEAVVTLFRGPASFTGEDVLEISIHGGPSIVEATLDTLCEHGRVRLAEPGEFTRRAVEAGKYDLVEAEAIADLIEASTEAQRRQALQQLRGVTSSVLEGWRKDLLESLALLEVAVDFPDEEDAPDYTHESIIERLEKLAASLSEVLSDTAIGEQVRDGFRVALVGEPNVGKSSLLNCLAGRDAAIVTDVPGTTRDAIDVRLNVGGYLVILTDTAGLRETVDPVEEEGVRRARRAAVDADIVLHIRAADRPSAFTDAAQWGGRTIDVLNKSDLGVDNVQSVSRETVQLSAKTNEGVDLLMGRLSIELASLASKAPPSVITRKRHRRALQSAQVSVNDALQGLRAGLGGELVSEDVRRAAQALTGLLGGIGVEEVLGEIFSSFCIGK